jgi:hypothetical protein
MFRANRVPEDQDYPSLSRSVYKMKFNEYCGALIEPIRRVSSVEWKEFREKTMSLSPVDWSVVVVGRWNRSILTPAGIGKRLFGLAEGTPLEVMLAIDAIAPPRVSHEGIIVVAGEDRLIVQTHVCSFSELDRARDLAKRALNDLPQTPVSGVGVNVKFKTEVPIDAITEVIGSPWDDQLSDHEYTIRGRAISRSLVWNDGSINLSVSMNGEGEQLIQFNFDSQSPDVDGQCKWLSIPIAEIESEVNKLLTKTMSLSQEDISSD